MNIYCVSGSRADKAALTPVASALNAGWISVTTEKSGSQFDSAVSCGLATIEAANKFKKLKPSLVILPGDRFEILGAANAAHLMGIPIAHLSGGDITEGSQDDSMRHAITKLAHLHFPTNPQSAQRIREMGEELWRIHTVGCPSIDYLLSQKLLSREETLKYLGMDGDYFLVAHQPATLSDYPLAEADSLIEALDELGTPCVITSLNTDAWAIAIHRKFSDFCRGRRVFYFNMDPLHYLSAMKHCQVMIGNSSSGLYEAPSLKVPFVNVGVRQQGRLVADSVVSCSAYSKDIKAAVAKAKNLDCSKTINPYGDGKAAGRIKEVIEVCHDLGGRLLRKRWLCSTGTGKKFTENGTGGHTQASTSSGGSAKLLPFDHYFWT